MKNLLRTVALTAVALGCFTAETQAREADFVYQVWACEMPTHAVMAYKNGHRYYDSFHFSLADAEDRADLIEEKGVYATILPLDGGAPKQYVYQNSVLVKEFDNAADAEAFADEMMEHTGLFCWVKKVEVYPWGP